MFHALPFHYSLCFPCAHYVSLLHFLGLHSFPSTLSYCSRLDYSVLALVSRSGASALQYIYFVYLYSTTSELILLTSPSSLSEVLQNARILRLGSGRLASPLFSNSFLWHMFWCGQLIAVRQTWSFVFPSVHPDPVGSERNNNRL